MQSLDQETFELEQKLVIAESLLRQALPFILYHYERSAVGYGKGSKDLIDAIKIFIGEEDAI